MKKLIFIMMALAVSGVSHAAWKVNSELSKVNFISTKVNDVAEAHHFNLLDGQIDDEGSLLLTIDLDSVNTAIPIRDERMRKLLFKTANFPYAEVKASVEEAMTQLEEGQSFVQQVSFQLNLHGFKKQLDTSVMVSQLDKNTLLVANTKPIIVLAGDFGLDAGVKKLQEIAGLPMISNAVPVNFVLTFNKQ